MSQTPTFLSIMFTDAERTEARIPAWPLRIIWHQVFSPFRASFEVVRQPPIEEALSMNHEAWDKWEPYPVRRDYFPPSERRWTRIRDAILKRRGIAPPRKDTHGDEEALGGVCHLGCLGPPYCTCDKPHKGDCKL